MPPVTPLLRSFWLLFGMLAAAPSALATSGFELDLKELKRPGLPPSLQKKIPAAPDRKTPPAAAKTPATVRKPAGQVSDPLQPARTFQPHDPSELTLKQGNPCRLAEQIAVAVAHAVPEHTLLFGLKLTPVAAVTFGGLQALVLCNLPEAEAYTYGRLLADHDIQLVNISADTDAAMIVARIADALGLTYRLEKEAAAPQAEQAVLFPAAFERKRPLRLTIQP